MFPYLHSGEKPIYYNMLINTHISRLALDYEYGKNVVNLTSPSQISKVNCSLLDEISLKSEESIIQSRARELIIAIRFISSNSRKIQNQQIKQFVSNYLFRFLLLHRLYFRGKSMETLSLQRVNQLAINSLFFLVK